MLNKNISLYLQVCLFVFACIIYSFSANEAYNPFLLRVLLLGNILATIFFFCTADEHNIKDFYYRPFLLFIFGYFVVFFQRYFDLAIGLVRDTDHVFLKSGLIIKSLSMSSAGYIALLIGYLSHIAPKHFFAMRSLFWINTLFIKRVFYFSFILFILFKAKDLLTGNYSQEDLEQAAGGMSNYSSILFIVSYFSLLSISVYNSNIKGIKTIRGFMDEFGVSCLLIALCATIMYLISGSRSHPFLIVCSLAFAICYLLRFKISFLKLSIIVLLGSFFFSFIGATRNIQSGSVYDKMKAMDLKMDAEKTILPTTLELSGSLETFLYAIDYVPVSHDYLYGSFHLRNLLSAIPFSSRLTSQFLDPHKKYHSSDFFVTYIIQGENYTYGNGTSLNADLYLNYGFLGIILGLFFMGRFIRIVEYSSYMYNIPSLMIVLFLMYIAGYALIYVRNGYLAPVNFVAFSAILNYYCKNKYMMPL